VHGKGRTSRSTGGQEPPARGGHVVAKDGRAARPLALAAILSRVRSESTLMLSRYSTQL